MDSKVADFSLKTGEKIHINLKVCSLFCFRSIANIEKGGTTIAKAEDEEQGEPIALLPPPPANSRSRINKPEAEAQESGFDDDFGDFQ